MRLKNVHSLTIYTFARQRMSPASYLSSYFKRIEFRNARGLWLEINVAVRRVLTSR